MHHHNQDLIMALAEGDLDATAAAAARAEIESCPECAADLELQTLAIDSLAEIPEAELTELEAARLGRDVRRELGIAKATKVVAVPAKQRRPVPVAALATAAAVLVAVVVVAPALNLIGGGGDSSDDGFETAVATTAAAAQAPRAALEESPTLAPADSGSGAADATTLAPSLSTTTFVQEGLTGLAYFTEAPDLGALRLQISSTDYDLDESRDLTRAQSLDSVIETDEATVNACISITLSNSDEFIDGFQIARGSYEGREAIFYVFLAEDLENSAIIVQAGDNCEELARAGP